MSHDIVNNQLAFVGAVPWHGLGVQVEAGATGAQMLRAAELDWKVVRHHIAMKDEAGELLASPLVNYRAIARDKDHRVFQIATDSYQPVQNAETVDFFREYCEAGHATMETVGALRDGAVIWALARLNGGSSATIGTDDELRGYMLLATSHDASLKTIGQPTQVRVVCANTLRAAMSSHDTPVFRLSHRTKFDQRQKDEARRVMGMAIEQVAELNTLSAKLATVNVGQDEWLTFMSRLMGGADAVIDPKTAALTKVAEDIREATISSPGSGLATSRGTLWGVVNGVTYYVDHVKRSRSQQNRVFGAWFGDGDRMKNDAVRIAAELAGVGVTA
jgi:phage/plasmid-like protein (TIGR03299 family)